ncbi:MAG: DUF2341 domain-containing protein, partial [Candidatus Kariarchaeaceae archaeon]
MINRVQYFQLGILIILTLNMLSIGFVLQNNISLEKDDLENNNSSFLKDLNPSSSFSSPSSQNSEREVNSNSENKQNNRNYRPSSYKILNGGSGQQPSDYSYFKDITIDSSKISGTNDLINFPFLISLNDSDLKTDVQSDGDDIAFANSITWLDHEIELFDQSYNSTHAQLVVWVRIPSLSATVDTVITMYYGNPTIGNMENPIGVWAEDYIAVWHLKENGNGTAGEYKDSTSNNNDGQGGGNTGINPPAYPPSQITGLIGSGQEFDELTQEHIEVSTSASLESPSNSITIEGWVNSFISGLDGSIVFSNWGYGIDFLNGEVLVHLNGTTNNVTSWVWWPTNIYTSLGWHQYTLTYDGSFERLFIDGIQVGVADCTGSIAIGDPNPNTLRIGSNPTWGTPQATGYTDGQIDEVRISTDTKTADWISTEYNNQIDPTSFYSTGLAEQNIPAPWYNEDWLYRKEITINQSMVEETPWYDTDWQYRKKIVVSANYSTIPSNYSVSLTFDHSTLVSNGKSRADGDDVRVVYWNGSTWNDLDRMLEPDSLWNSSSTKVFFKTQSQITANSSDVNYYLYYGNNLADPPPTNSSDIFFFYDGFESGNLSSWDGFSEGSAGDSISASTDQAYTGTYSAKAIMDTVASPQAMVYDDFPNELNLYARVPIYLDPSFSITDRLTVMQFVDTDPGWQNLLSVTIDQDMTLYMWNAVAGEAYGFGIGNTISTGVWHTLAFQAKISDTAGEARLWLDDNIEIEATAINLSTNGIDKFAAGIYWAGDNEANTLYVDDIYSRLYVDSEPFTVLGNEREQFKTNFPLLINRTDTNFRDLGNGGHVGQSDGGDILFTSSDGTTKLNHEMEKFDSTVGEIIAWVNLPALSSKEHTSIFMYYGNEIVSDQANPTGVWNNNYNAVWHLSQNVFDSTTNNNHGTNFGSTDVIGKIANGQNFDGIDDYIDGGSGTTIDNLFNGGATIGLWIYPTGWGENNYGRILDKSTSTGGSNGWALYVDNDGGSTTRTIIFQRGFSTNRGVWGAPTDSIRLNQWYHVVIAYDDSSPSNDPIIYINGSSQTVIEIDTPSGVASDDSAQSLRIGNYAGDTTRTFDGIIDNIRIHSTLQSADWILSEYDNQYQPENFYSVGLEESSWQFSPNDYEYLKQFTIDNSKVNGISSLIDFPVLINFYDSDLRTKVQADGDDIIFADSSNKQLDHEMELFNQTSNSTHAHLVAWVRVPSLSAIVDTNITMYYGNSTVGNHENPVGVWDSNYQGVWHLNQNPITDSTTNNNHGYTSGSMTSGDLVSSVLGNGMGFDGINDIFIVNDSLSLDSVVDDATLSIWINWVNSSDGDYQRIMTSSNTFPDRLNGMEWSSQPDGDHFFYPWSGNNSGYNLITDPFTDNQWQYTTITMNYTAKEVKIYINGNSMTFTVENIPDGWTQLTVIDDWLWGGHPNVPGYFAGIFDEIRVLDTVRPENWIITEYNNQIDPSSFYSIGPELYSSPDITPPVLNDFGLEDPGAGTGTFWADVTDDISVNNVTLEINSTTYNMIYNGSLWTYQLGVTFGDYFTYQIVNSSDTSGNFLSSPSSINNHTFNIDNTAPNVVDWIYDETIGYNGT